MGSQRLIQALAKGKVVVKNRTSGEVSVFYPVMSKGHPTREKQKITMASNQILNLTSIVSIEALRLSSNLKKLVKAHHLVVVD